LTSSLPFYIRTPLFRRILSALPGVLLKQLVLAAVALSIAAFAPVNPHQCRTLREEVVRPVQQVKNYFEMQPDLEALAGPGCLYILRQTQGLAQTAETLRQLATRSVDNVTHRCADSVNSLRYRCDSADGRCLPESYTYCSHWEYTVSPSAPIVSDPRYEASMELANKLDVAYDKIQRLCGAAMSFGESETMTAVTEVRRYLETEVEPRNEKLMELSCAQ
jgi:hypothetical protein